MFRWKWARQLAVRIVGSIGRIDQGICAPASSRDEEWPRLTEAIENCAAVSLHIDETRASPSANCAQRAAPGAPVRQAGPDRGGLPPADERLRLA